MRRGLSCGAARDLWGSHVLVLARDDRLLLEQEAGLCLWDVEHDRLVSTFKHVAEFQPRPTSRPSLLDWAIFLSARRLPLDHGNIAIWNEGGRGFIVVNPEDGRIEGRTDRMIVHDISTDGRRVLGSDTVDPLRPMLCDLWSESGGWAKLGDVAGASLRLSDDGRWICVEPYRWLAATAPASRSLLVLDSASRATVLEIPEGQSCRGTTPTAGDYVPTFRMASGAWSADVWSIGARSRIAAIPLGDVHPVSAELSDDGRYLLLILGRWPNGPFARAMYMRVVALSTQQVVYDVPLGVTPYDWGPDLSPTDTPRFLDNSRILVPMHGGGARVMTTETPRPLAILDSGEPSETDVAPGGQTVAILNTHGEVTVWRKVGRECRESIFGILGMPHVWGLILVSGLLALVAWRDARRGCEAAGAMMTSASLAMVLAGAGMSLMMLLEWCLGRWEPNVGPALLVCGIGLATGGRGRRWVALVALAVCLAMGTVGLQGMMAGGMNQATALRVLDRVWDVPKVCVMGLVMAAVAASAGAVVVVARKA